MRAAACYDVIRFSCCNDLKTSNGVVKLEALAAGVGALFSQGCCFIYSSPFAVNS